MMRKRSDKGYTKLNKHEKLGHAHDILLISKHARIRTLTAAPAGSLHLILTYLLTSVQSKWRRLARSTGRRAKLTIHRRHFFSVDKNLIFVSRPPISAHNRLFQFPIQFGFRYENALQHKKLDFNFPVRQLLS